MLGHLKEHLKGKAVVLGIGNTLRNDDGIGSILAGRIKDKVSCIVYDAGSSPENYLGKIIKDKPDNIIIVDAVDFGGIPGEYRILEGDLKTANLFSTHNASISLTINYLKSNLGTDIIILAVQPKNTAFGDSLSQEMAKTLRELEEWFINEKKR